MKRPRSWSSGRLVATGLALVIEAAPGHASGQGAGEHREVERCFSSAEAAQPLMHRRELQAAQLLLRECSRDECPKAARTDCRTWLEAVTKALPTVVFAAREEGGGAAPRPVDDLVVIVDGQRLAARVDGGPLPLDPGEHQVRLEHAGFDPVEERLELREGEHRQVDAVFRRADVEPPPRPAPRVPVRPPPPRVAPPPPPPPETAPVPTLAYGLGGTAVVALGAGVTLEIIGLSARSQLVSTCQPNRSCAPSAVDSARDRVAAGDVLLGVGSLLLGGAAYVYFTRPAGAPATSGALRLRLGAVGGAASLGLEGSL